MAAVCLPTALSLQEQTGRDGGVRAALRHEFEDLALARGEPGEGDVAGVRGEQLGDHLGVYGGVAGRDPPHRLDELVGVDHPVLDQISDRPGAVGQQLPGVQLLDVLGQHEHGQARDLAAGRQGRLQPLVGVGHWKPYVDHGHVGSLARQREAQLGSTGDGGGYLEPMGLEQHDQAVS
jgi:hypothetical protein